MTNGFIKKTQKTPKSEIELAKKYRHDFVDRMGGQMKSYKESLKEMLEDEDLKI